MTGPEFKLALKNPKNIYCLISTDSEIIDLYVDRFKNAIKADLISYGQIKPYGKLFKKKTLNVLYMPKVDESIFNRNEYIFIYTDNIDKRSSIYKQHKDQYIELDNDYTKYISDLYKWIDCFIKKQSLPRINESPISVMALLSTNCQNILKVKQNKISGMNPYIVKCAKELDSYITEEELVQLIGDCFYLDSQIKKGLIDIDYVLEYLKVRRYSNGFTN